MTLTVWAVSEPDGTGIADYAQSPSAYLSHAGLQRRV